MKTKIKLNKVPSVFKNVTFPNQVIISSTIPAQEGSIIMVEAENNEGKFNILDYVGGRLGKLWQWDKIPAVLGSRKATTEFAGFVPSKIVPGDELYLLCESGVVGALSGVVESWGRPMKVKVLGGILDKYNKPMNLKTYKIPLNKKKTSPVPLILFLGTRMDSGKTTMACKIGHNLHSLGKKVAGVKLTGVAFTQDLLKLSDAGVSPVYDFVDMGLPSTCNGNPQEVVESALNLVDLAKKDNPDCILVEFGDAVLGEYHVAEILMNKLFKSQIKIVILAANDLAGIKGTMDILLSWGIKIDIVTGPIANSHIGINLIEKHFHLKAESNLHNIPNTIEILKKKIFPAKK